MEEDFTDNTPRRDLLKMRQQYPLDLKVQLSLRRVEEWVSYWGKNNVYVAFSGGKDSTVLLHLVRSKFPDIPAVFVDTGLEYPENREFVKQTENVIWLKPKMAFTEVLKTKGYPVVSKESAKMISNYRTTKSERVKHQVLYGNHNGQFKLAKRWQYLLDAPFKISAECCKIMKIKPFTDYEKQTGAKGFVGTMSYESLHRRNDYITYGCNAFKKNKPTSKPLSFWLEKDVWEYIKKYNVKYSAIYDKGYPRTGCMFCMFGVHLEKEPNRFQLMKKTHPKQYDYCINKLGLGYILDYIGVKY